MRKPPRQAETGAVLAICMVFLLLVTLMAIAGSRAAINQQRMAGNHVLQQGLLLAAENALLQVEQALLDEQIALPEQPCAQGSCQQLVSGHLINPQQLRAAGWQPVAQQADSTAISLWYRLSLLQDMASSAVESPMQQGRRYRLSVLALNAPHYTLLEAVYERQPR